MLFGSSYRSTLILILCVLSMKSFPPIIPQTFCLSLSYLFFCPANRRVDLRLEWITGLLQGEIIFPLAACLSPVYSPSLVFRRHSRTRFLFYRAKGGGCHVPPSLSLLPRRGGMRERSFPCEIRCQICSPATHSAQSRLTCPAAQSAGCSTSTCEDYLYMLSSV